MRPGGGEDSSGPRLRREQALERGERPRGALPAPHELGHPSRTRPVGRRPEDLGDRGPQLGRARIPGDGSVPLRTLVGDGVVGLAVHIAARVMAEAGPGEVLVSRTVRDLVAGSGISFVERGTRVLKGVPGEWQLYAVDG